MSTYVVGKNVTEFFPHNLAQLQAKTLYLFLRHRLNSSLLKKVAGWLKQYST